MITSMTGFSRYEITEKGCRIVVEVRSLNNKFMDVSVKLPRRLTDFEDEVKNVVRAETARGKIEVSVSLVGLEEIIQDVTINIPLAKQYMKAFRQLERECGMPVTVKPEDLLKIEDIFEYSISDAQLHWVKRIIIKAVERH